MAHPYAGHKEVHVAHRRAHKHLHGVEHKGGGRAHDDEAADRALFKKLIKEHDLSDGEGAVHGGKARDRYARGGRTKHKGDVNIAIVTPRHHTPQAPPVPVAPAAGGAPPPAMPPAGLPPGMPPGMPPPQMRKHGGKVKASKYIDGYVDDGQLKDWKRYASKNSHHAAGGKVKFKGGAESGVGRLEKAHHMKGRGRGR